MTGTVDDERLLGTWTLESYVTVGDGGTGVGPLGPDPSGLLLYGADGHMAVSMMANPPGGAGGFMGYAGTWRLDGDRVFHHVTVSSHAYLVGTEQVRDLSMDGDRLVLSGDTPPGAGPPARRALIWRRV